MKKLFLLSILSINLIQADTKNVTVTLINNTELDLELYQYEKRYDTTGELIPVRNWLYFAQKAYDLPKNITTTVTNTERHFQYYGFFIKAPEKYAQDIKGICSDLMEKNKNKYYTPGVSAYSDIDINLVPGMTYTINKGSCYATKSRFNAGYEDEKGNTILQMEIILGLNILSRF